MLLLIFTIISIANGLLLDIPIKFNRPKWMNNSDSLDTFFNTNPHESYIHGTSKFTCITFKQSKISYGNIAFESKCTTNVKCKIPTFVPPKYCPLSGSLKRIVFYLNDTLDEAFYIVAKGCYLNKGEEKVEGDWYISNKNKIDLKNLKKLQTDFLDISDPNFMKCSVLCNAIDCSGPFKIEFGLRFHSEEGEQMNYNKFVIASIGGGILVLVVLIVIFFFVKNFKNK